MNTNDAEKKSQNQVKKLLVNSVVDYIKEVEYLVKDYTKENLVFRGHESVDYDLIPSIGRKDKQNNQFLYGEVEEKNMFYEFCRLYYPYTKHRPIRRLDMLFLAQHYELPTRLLDWSFNPLIALYFACEEDKDKKNGQVLVRSAVNKNKSKGKEGENKIKIRIEDSDVDPFEDFKENQIIIPDNIDIRYRNQQGVFEIFANPWKENKEVVARIDIPHDAKSAIRESLSHVGIDKKFVYPTLENLAKEIGDKYKNGNRSENNNHKKE